VQALIDYMLADGEPVVVSIFGAVDPTLTRLRISLQQHPQN
jgi:hypothetical protein